MSEPRAGVHGRRPDPPRRCAPQLLLLLLFALHALAVAVFTRGYLLRRIQLLDRSSTPPLGAGTAPPYDRLVLVLVDALRYDFVVADARYPCPPPPARCHQGQMPGLAALLREHPSAARAFNFVADAPTTTTQRLRAMTTGGLPSFFDVGASFDPGALAEDNLIDQLAAAGKRLAFVGDATWASLFPHQFRVLCEALPCYNVRDLHSVDDAVGSTLPALLAAPATWDVAVAHYLGVDHAGHAHGCGSAEMAAKLGQVDGQVAAAVEAMAAGAGPGGPYARTLLLVAGDHGQTLGGDHGGGSPEEVDSALVALDLAALHASRLAAGRGGAVPEAGSSAAACRAGCRCGVDRNQCADDLPQIDLTPTLAALLGVPIPFGNLGKVSVELWGLAAGHGSSSAGWQEGLLTALRSNADQVHAYLATYAAKSGGSFSREVEGLGAEYSALGGVAAEGGLEQEQERLLAFLRSAEAAARRQWTQFSVPDMAAGLLLFAGALLLNAWLAFREAVVPWRPLGAVLLALAALHSVGIFSFYFLLSEGTMVCYIVAGMSLALAATAGGARGLLWGAAALASCAALAMLGLAHHTGQGFWARLTQQKPMQIAVWEAVMGWLPTGADTMLAGGVYPYLLRSGLPTVALAAVMGRVQARFSVNGRGYLQRYLAYLAFGCVLGYHALEDEQSQLTLDTMLAGSTSLVLPSWAALLADLPLRILLPRAAYAAGAFGLLLWLVTSLPGVPAKGRGHQAANAAATLQLILLPILLQISTPSSALVVLIGALEVVCITKLLALRSARHGVALLEWAALVAALQSQMFYVGGHLCEFAGLHYPAGFVGFDDFQFHRSGSLLAMHTFGGVVLVALAAPIAWHSMRGSRDSLGSLLLAIALLRALTAFAATLSAAIQHRHLYAWALFAPKFFFESCFMFITDIALLLLSCC